eukprot:ANDGO_01592.mRNA.1 Protein pelota
MRVVKREIDAKEGEGSMTLVTQDPDDLWHLYYLIAPGDDLTMSTVRKVSTAPGSATAERMRLTLCLEVTKLDIDPEAASLRVSGRNKTERAEVKIGQFHTFTVEPGDTCVLKKKKWDKMYLERVETACDTQRRADVAAVIMSDGLANICLVSPHRTILLQEIEVKIPKKRGEAGSQEKSITRFLDSVCKSLLRIKQDVVKCVLVASVGFLNQRLMTFAASTDPYRTELAPFLREAAVMCKASSGHLHSLAEVLADPVIQSKLRDTKAAAEIAVLQKFISMLAVDPHRAFYGYAQVRAACDAGAVATLLITDELLFRPSTKPSWLQERARYVKLVEDVRSQGGAVSVFSAMHVSGEQLRNLTGIAAILRHPMEDLEEMDTFEDFLREEEEEKEATHHEDAQDGSDSVAEVQKKDGASLDKKDRPRERTPMPYFVEAVPQGKLRWEPVTKKILMDLESGEVIEVEISYDGELSATNSEDGLSDRDDDLE